MRCTFSVVPVFACPTRWAMSSMGFLRWTAGKRSCVAAPSVSIPLPVVPQPHYLAEGAANVSCVEGGAELRREDHVVSAHRASLHTCVSFCQRRWARRASTHS